MAIKTYIKDPDARLDFNMDWEPWIADGDSITGSTWACSDPALVLEDSENDALTTTIWISGGVLGKTYIVTNHITTNIGPRIDDRSIKIKIRSQ